MMETARTTTRPFVLGLVAVVSMFTGLEARAGGAPEPRQDGQELLRYVRVGTGGAKVQNLNDPQAETLLELPAGSVLAVHSERANWMNVEVPGGFKVWVWGEFLEPTEEFGVLKVTASDLRMRPLPSSGIESYPIEQRLGRGQKLRMIGRKDESLPMARDWVQVWSPPGARAWVRADATTALAAGDNGSALWAAAIASALDARKPAPVTTSAAAKAAASSAAAPKAGGAQAQPATAGAQNVAEALRQANSMLAAERKVDQDGGSPNYAAVIAAYEAVLALEPKGPSADVAQGRIETAKLLADAHQLKDELQTERAEREAKLAVARREMELAKSRDAFFGRFEARGWIEQRRLPGRSEPVWMLSWSGKDVAEVVCHSGRYDLSVFKDHELGINGRTLRGAVEASSGVPRPMQIDVSRIEVLAGRGR